MSRQATSSPRHIRVALAGNPNAGKTTVFNGLTGARQHVGNYPGVTVEKKEGRFVYAGVTIDVIDLPGTYSLTAYSPEELVARQVVLDERPDLVVDILDASNLERNLYLATQFMELGVPLLLVMNMSDLARARGYEIDAGLLSRLFGVEIVSTVGHRETGLDSLREAIVRIVREPQRSMPRPVRYGKAVEGAMEGILEPLAAEHDLVQRYAPRWLAIKLLESDPEVLRMIRREAVGAEAVLAAAAQGRQAIESEFADSAEIIVADSRYGFISGACQEAVRSTVESRHSMSDQIDRVLTNRVVGIPIFLTLMYLTFKLTFTVGGPFMGLIEHLVGWVATVLGGLWPEGSDSLLRSMVVDGMVGGVGGVLVFLPNILLLFLAISFLEGTGYMARAAFIMDRFMHKIGLHGKSFIPMLIGFGCTVPAILATRTLENRRDRLTTILIAPLMSCGARLPIYALFIPAFFPARWHAPLLALMYFTGIALACILAKLLRSTLFRGETSPFVMELPPYRLPTLKAVFLHMWERAWLYMKKAGTVILGMSIILWALTAFPRRTEFTRDYPAIIAAAESEGAQERAEELRASQRAEEMQYSVAGRIGRSLEPVLKPLGFDWRVGTALIAALAAKEVFVAQLGILFSVADAEHSRDGLRAILTAQYTPLNALCIMLFCLITAPCVATIAVTRRETNSWGWAAFQLLGLTVLAYVVTFLVYQGGLLLGLNG